MKTLQILVLVLIIHSLVSAQTTISGHIGGMTFTPSGNPWIVSENVFIEKDSKAVIKQGCVFLFKPFSGLIVRGDIVVDGDKDMPVVFTSINDSAYNSTANKQPESFDWNGIIIEKDAAHVLLAHFKLSYSTYGIKSKTADLHIKSGVFRQNGQFHFTINDKIQQVETNLPFNYNTADMKLPGEETGRWVKPVGFGSIAVGTIFLGAMGYSIYSANDYDKKYENSKNSVSRNYLDKRDSAIRTAIITGVLGGLLVPAGTGLLLWEYKKNSVALYPVVGDADGFQIVMKF